MNKYQKKIKEMHDKLAPVGKSFTDTLIKNISVHGFYHKGVVKCIGCGHRFAHAHIEKDATGKGVCPHCHREISIVGSGKWSGDGYAYGTVIQNVNDEFVVFRLFSIYYMSSFDKNGVLKENHTSIDEVRQIWYDVKNDVTTYMSVYLMPYPHQSRCPYRHDTEMIVRSQSNIKKYYGSYDISSTYSGPVIIESLPKQISYLNTNDIIKDVCYMEDTLRSAIKFPVFEALFKKRMYYAIDMFSGRGYIGCENEELRNKKIAALKIALRHGYIEKLDDDQYALWRDYVNELIKLDKDIHNPFYVCPENLYEAHTATSIKVTKLEAEIKKKEMYEHIKACTPKFIEDRGRFFPFSVTDGTITIEPLKSIEDFVEEATYMHNCLVSNMYYSPNIHPNSLILSARLGDWGNALIIEDIEIDMRSWRVVQCHGRFNQNTEYHDQIIRLICDNIEKIRKLNNPKNDENKTVQMHQEAV